jgi:hypothetical protein
MNQHRTGADGDSGQCRHFADARQPRLRAQGDLDDIDAAGQERLAQRDGLGSRSDPTNSAGWTVTGVPISIPATPRPIPATRPATSCPSTIGCSSTAVPEPPCCQ